MASRDLLADNNYALKCQSITVNEDPETSVLLTFTGPWAAGHAVTAYLKKTGVFISCFIPAINEAYANNTFATAGLAAIPASYRPITYQEQLCEVINNTAYTTGKVTIADTGELTICGNITTGLFSVGGNAGWGAFTCSWSTK